MSKLAFRGKWVLLIVSIMAISFIAVSEARESVVLKVWSTQVEYDSIPATEFLVQKFEQENPGIEIDLQIVPWGEIEAKWAPAVAAGTQPDISSANPVHMSSLAGGGYLEPVDDVINVIGPENLQPNYLRLQKMPNGKYYGIPYIVAPITFWYRKDLMAEAGLEVPKRWDEWLNAAAKLKTEETWGTLWWVSPNVNHVFEATNKSYWLGPDGNVVYNSPETIEAFKFMKELSNYGPAGFLNYGFTEVNNALTYGKVAMAPHYTDFIVDLSRRKPDLMKNMGNAQIPANKVEGTGIGGNCWIMFKSPRTEEAGKFLQFMMRKENVKYWFQEAKGGWLPPLNSLFDDPDFWNKEPYKSYPDVYKVLVQNAIVGSLQGMDFENWPYAGEIEGSWINVIEFQKYALEGKPVDKAVADAAREMERIVEAARRTYEVK